MTAGPGCGLCGGPVGNADVIAATAGLCTPCLDRETARMAAEDAPQHRDEVTLRERWDRLRLARWRRARTRMATDDAAKRARVTTLLDVMAPIVPPDADQRERLAERLGGGRDDPTG